MYWEAERKEKPESKDYWHHFQPFQFRRTQKYSASLQIKALCNVFPAMAKDFIHVLFRLSLPNILTFVCMSMYYHTKQKRIYLPLQLQKQNWENSSQQAGQGYVSFPLWFLLHLGHLQLIYSYAEIVYIIRVKIASTVCKRFKN